MNSIESKTAPLSIRVNALWNSFGCFTYLGCQWLTTVLAATLAPGYKDSGILSLAMNVGLMLTVLGTFNMRTFQVSDIDHRFNNAEYIGFRITSVLVACIVCSGYSLALYHDPSTLAVILLYLVFKADESFVDVLYGIYQINGRMDYIGKSQLIRGVVSLSTFVLGLKFFSSLTYAIAFMAMSCIAITLLFDIPHERLFGSNRPIINLSIARAFITNGTPIMIASFFNTSIASAVRQLYGLMNDAQSLGIYAAIATPSVIIQVAMQYLYAPWLTTMSSNYKKGHSIFIAQFSKLLVLLIIASVVLIAICTPLGINFLPKLYGGIDQYIWIFPYVLIATASIALLSFIYNGLVVKRQLLRLFFMEVIGFVISITSASYLIQSYGMNGINLAISLGALSASIVGLIFVYRR